LESNTTKILLNYNRTTNIQLSIATIHCCYFTLQTKWSPSNATRVTEVRSASTRLFAGMWRPLVSVTTTTLLCCDYFSSSSVLSLLYVCIWSSGIILIS